MTRHQIIPFLMLLFISISCQPPEQEVITASYNEQYRPQIHFSPPANWMNDPNGMVYYEGEYHLFYQYYPDSTVWGPMHWGHAVSKDLVTWENLPTALYPDDLGYIFSGSAVVDWNNTSGIQEGDEPPMVAIFTHHEPVGAEESGNDKFQYQSIAYSNDKGRTWTKFEGNPVLPNPGIRDFRDPKVFWHKASEKWIMILAAEDKVQLYNSSNLTEWNYLSEFGSNLGAHGGVWECPDLFQLPINEGETEKWVMLVSINPGGPNGGSATQYFVGDFDGETFKTKQTDTKWLDHGRDNYAGVTWSDVPEADGRRLFIGWMSNWDYAQVVPTSPWRSAMTLPRSLHLVESEDQYLVYSKPIEELDKIEIKSELIIENNELVTEAQPLTLPVKTEVTFDLTKSTATKFGLELNNEKGESFLIGYDVARAQLFTDRSQSGMVDFEERFAGTLDLAPLSPQGGYITLAVYIDESSIEIFANEGETVMTQLAFPTAPYNTASVFYTDGELHINRLSNTTLKSIW